MTPFLKEFYGMEHFPYEIYSFYMSHTTDKIEMDKINEEIAKLQNQYKKSANEIKKLINESIGDFYPYEDWQ